MASKRQHERDLKNGFGSVYLPSCCPHWGSARGMQWRPAHWMGIKAARKTGCL